MGSGSSETKVKFDLNWNLGENGQNGYVFSQRK